MSLLCFLALSASAATTVSLDDAVARAVADSPEATVAIAREDIAHADRAAARSALYPQLVGQLQYQHFDSQIEFPNPFVDDGSMIILQKQDSLALSATATQVLFTPATIARSAAAGAQYDAAMAQHDGASQDLAVRAVAAWVQVRQTGEYADVVRALLDDAIAKRDLMLLRRSAEAATNLDVERSEVTVADMRRQLIEAGRAYADARGQLALLCGLPQDFEMGTPTEAPVETRDEAALIERAKSHRPEVLAAKAQLEAAKAGRWGVVADWSPTVSAVGNVRATNNPGLAGKATIWYAGINASLPILDGGLRFADAERVSAQRSMAEAQLERAELAAEEDVRAALRSEAAAGEALTVATQQVELAKAAKSLVEAGFDNGTATFVDVQDADDAVLQAEIGRIRAEGAVWQSRWQVRRVTGDAT